MSRVRTTVATVAAGLIVAASTAAFATSAEAAQPQVTPQHSAHTQLAAFTTPTGNIGCIVVGEAVACTVIERNWELGPVTCETGSSDGVVLYAAGQVRSGCLSQSGQALSDPGTVWTRWLANNPETGHVAHYPQWGSTAVLDYGSSIKTDDLIVTSTRTGVKIQDRSDGSSHGHISRENALVLPGPPQI